MKTSFFVLATAFAIGAIAGSLLRLGVIEIAIVWALLIGGYFGVRSSRSSGKSAIAQ